jgi:hypothetical protein
VTPPKPRNGAREASLHVRELESLRAELERRVGDLSPPRWNADPEDVGQALMRLEETIRDIGRRFGLAPEDLNLDLGPLGRLI